MEGDKLFWILVIVVASAVVVRLLELLGIRKKDDH